MKTWVNFHTHGKFSFLDGYGKYEQYFERAKKLGMPALGITEHGNIHGWLDFYDLAKEAGVKPALGMEAYQARKTRHDMDDEERAGRANDEWEQRGPHHLTLIAQNMAGYKNIIKLSSRAYLEGYYVKPRLDFELLQDHCEGVIVLSGCLSGKIQQAILRGDLKMAETYARTYQEIVGKDNFFIEVMNHHIKEEQQVFQHLVDLAKKVDAKIIPTNDCHYVHKVDAHNHDLMLCISTGARFTDENRFRFANDEFYLKSHDEMAELFPEEWLKNTLDLADRIDLDLKFDQLHFPEFPIESGKSVDDVLEQAVWEGVKKFYPDWEERTDVKERVEHELGVVKRMGFQHYFLVVSDITGWARSQGIRTGWGRGSGAGSIISYVLGITGLDPIKFGLLFERFLVEGRVSPPDIDLDFNDARRDEVIDYIKSKYGTDRVANIGTFSEIGARAAVKDAARVLSYDYSVGDKISKLLPPPILGVAASLKDSMKFLEKDYNSNSDTKKIVDAALGFEGLLRQTGIHPAGVLITPGPIIDYIPVMQKGPDAPVISQWDMHRVEKNGLLKVDCLGLRNLRIIDECLELVKQTRNEEVDVYNLPLDDQASYKELCEGNTMGIFQLESPNMRQMVVSMQPSDINDIMAVLSLYRPGPMGSGMDKMYVARKHGREQIKYSHPALESILEDNYGIMLYQEDVLNVAKKFAGMTPLQADALRKDIGKKEMDKIHKHRQVFVDGAKAISKAPESVSNKIYSDIEFFGGYGFNKCLTGETVVAQYLGGTNKYDRDYKEWKIEELYRKIHWQFQSDSFFPGPCIVCGKNNTLYRNATCLQCDSWRYRFQKNGIKILAFNEVTQKYENAKLVDVVCQGIQDVYEIHLVDGRRLHATANHKSLTKDGWKRTDELTPLDSMVCVNKDMTTNYVPVDSIHHCGKKVTYDVEMDSEFHNFVANGIVTHNSHAASYAIVSYVMSYLKAHYPAQYMAALLSSVDEDKVKAALYLTECRRMGIDVQAPSINRSDVKFKVLSESEILFGFSSVSGIGEAVAQLLKERGSQYETIHDFLRESVVDLLNKRTLESLLFSGAFDELIDEQNDRALRRAEKDMVNTLEKQYLGLYVTENPLLSAWHLLESKVDTSIESFDIVNDNRKVRVAGIITSVTKKMTRTGNAMYMFFMEDLGGSVQVIVWPNKASIYEDILQVGNIIIVEAILSFEGEEDVVIPKLKLLSMELADLPDWEAGEPIIFSVDEYEASMIDEIEQIIEGTPGDSPVYLTIPMEHGKITVRFAKPASLSVKEQILDVLEREKYAIKSK